MEGFMSEHPEHAEHAEVTEVTGHPEVTGGREPEGVAADLLVEEVSIDGMCGVY
jgi:mycofactocin precursor